ncbi:biotin--protein ligase isoform X2 [Lutzomyia longipalpis]|uniref:biotin--protein ligase isoform X2 n=1 Tax=Lutzomyia longipalpis TaxID=7200 RepID=UPI0024840F2C|nr:biotin--protein ligase isoform X2 [Lutzomyia longipalpis]XP_055680750.1 biotin--protein ligase isoform X2 [Lutzomyia longipalpis]
MLLTFYYMAATWIQSWRLRSVFSRITSKLTEHMSVVFYNLPSEINEVANTSVSSELCSNYTQARIRDVLWHSGSQRGCTLFPGQSVFLTPWVSFPKAPTLVPFVVQGNGLELEEESSVYLLLETETVPTMNENTMQLLIEGYGEPIAWKVDSHIAVILKSDIRRFTEIIMASFMQDCLVINDNLPLTRIQSIAVDGSPQPFDLVRNHAKKEFISRAMRNLSPIQWDKHLSGLRSMAILAQQASEYEYNKNRTEGKSGIVRPDLIPPTKPPEPNLVAKSPTKSEGSTSPKMRIDSLSLESGSGTTKAKTSPKVSPRTSPKTSPMKKIEEVDETLVSPPPSARVQKTPEAGPSSASGSKKPLLKRTKASQGANSAVISKPPNILVYSDSNVTRDNVIHALQDVLEEDTYTIYPLTANQVKHRIWMENTTLLVVCGSVADGVAATLQEFFLNGGKMLCLCSDLIHIVLPTYRTAEVREHELVQFSYGRWRQVKMMHHVFCYQPSPVKKHFSHDSDEGSAPPASSAPTASTSQPSVEVLDESGASHSVDVKVLGTEETWQTPSLVLAHYAANGGKAVFSQVHLEVDPMQFENDENKFPVLKQSNKARLEILMDLLGTHLSVVVRRLEGMQKPIKYTNGFFLGHHEAKFEMLDKLSTQMGSKNTFKASNLTLKFCGKNDEVPPASSSLLPILVHSCPDNFSTVDYFDTLKTEKVGRLVIYVPVVTSSMNVVSGLNLGHGVVVIPRHQTQGEGRNANQWLSPDGCLMFTVQLNVPLGSRLGQRIPLMQHLVATAMVSAINSLGQGYEDLDIRLKWPNDIYANGTVKIGGLVAKSVVDTHTAICNVGCAINLDNSTPTICLNDLIREHNKLTNANLPLLHYEHLLARIFNEIEHIFRRVQDGAHGLEYLNELYYKFWLHSGVEVGIVDEKGDHRSAKVMGIDEYGYLRVQTEGRRAESVHPDGNSFDMLKGLILPKNH